MPENNLFDINYLENSAKLFKDLKEKSYSPFYHLKDGIIADIGCGTGLDVVNLASITKGNNIKVIGLDFQKEMIEEAKSKTAALSDIEFLIGDVENIPFENNSLSGIRNERLLQHLKNPRKAFIEFYRVLKIGSPLVVLETDWSSMIIYNGTSEITSKVRSYLLNQNVNNGYSAITISNLLTTNHFKNISLNVFTLVSKRLEEVIAFTKLDFVLKKMEAEGYINKNEHADFLNNLTEANNGNYFACSINLIIATATK